jgi:serine/threonine protein kinase
LWPREPPDRGGPHPWLAPGREAFDIALTRVAILRRADPRRAWSADIEIVRSARSTDAYVYKRRRLLPTELVEIDDVFERLGRVVPPGVCRIAGYRIVGHFLHLLLRHERGTSFEHYHDPQGMNEPRFSQVLSALTVEKKLSVGIELLNALQALHRADLLYHDLKLEQLVVSDGGATLLDVDTIVVAGGVCASHGTWLPPQYFRRGPCTRETDAYLAGTVLYELLTGRHYRPGSADPVPEVARILLIEPSDRSLGSARERLAHAKVEASRQG